MKDLTEAVALYSKSNYDEAIAVLLEILQVEKQNWRAWFYLGLAYGDSGQVEHGYRIMQVISTLCPDKNLKLKARISAIELKNQIDRSSSQEALEQTGSRKSA
jgi:tetratricopeptide (TPR) repeat protein